MIMMMTTMKLHVVISNEIIIEFKNFISLVIDKINNTGYLQIIIIKESIVRWYKVYSMYNDKSN